MKKIIAIVLSLLLILGISVPVFADTNDQTPTIEEAPTYYDYESIDFSIDDDTYYPDETIVVSFVNDSDLKIESLDISSNGFQVSQNPSSSKITLPVYKLQFSSLTDEAYFSCTVTTTEGLQFLCELFAVKIDGIIYCSLVSFDSARSICFSSYLKSGVWTEEQYHAAYRELFKQYGNFTRKISCDPNEKNPTKTVISGTLEWIDDDDQTHPLQYVTVEIWDPLRSQKLATVSTNSLGFYSYSFYDTLSYRNYKIFVYPGGNYAIPENLSGVEYFHESDPTPNIPLGASVNISATFAMDSDINQAFQISQAVITAARYYEAMEGSALPKVHIVYPYQNTYSPFFYDEYKILIGDTLTDGYFIHVKHDISFNDQPNSYASWDAIMHEYGHHVARLSGITKKPISPYHATLGNCIDITIANIDRLDIELEDAKELGLATAWGEAYPTVFALLAQNYYSSSLNSIFTVGDATYTASNHSAFDIESSTDVYGDGCEGAIMGVLWDLFDNTPTEPHDTISMGHASLWSLVSDSGAITMFDFVFHYMCTQSISAQRKLSTLLSYYRIAAYDLDYTITPWTISFSWRVGGSSTRYYPNNSFDLVFCNADQEEIFRIEYLSGLEQPSEPGQPSIPPSQKIFEYTLTAAEYATIINECGSTFGFYVVAFQTDAPATGLYESEYITVSIPN